MENPVIADRFDISIDPKGLWIVLVNHAKKSLRVNFLAIEVSGRPGESSVTALVRTPINMEGELILPIYSAELQDAISDFHRKNPDAATFQIKVILKRSRPGDDTPRTEHATFRGNFREDEPEVDEFPFESGQGPGA